MGELVLTNQITSTSSFLHWTSLKNKIWQSCLINKLIINTRGNQISFGSTGTKLNKKKNPKINKRKNTWWIKSEKNVDCLTSKAKIDQKNLFKRWRRANDPNLQVLKVITWLVNCVETNKNRSWWNMQLGGRKKNQQRKLDEKSDEKNREKKMNEKRN